MFYESDTTHQLGVAYGLIPDHDCWTTAEMVDIFRNLLDDGWRTGAMTPEMARRWGTRLSHYGRSALAEQETR